MKIANVNLIASSTSIAANWTSEAINVEQDWFAAIHLVVTGTPAGNFKFQASCDDVPDSTTRPQTGVTNWVDVGTPVTVSAAGSTMLKETDIAYSWIRVVYTATGAGTTPVLTVARLNTKGV